MDEYSKETGTKFDTYRALQHKDKAGRPYKSLVEERIRMPLVTFEEEKDSVAPYAGPQNIRRDKTPTALKISAIAASTPRKLSRDADTPIQNVIVHPDTEKVPAVVIESDNAQTQRICMATEPTVVVNMDIIELQENLPHEQEEENLETHPISVALAACLFFLLVLATIIYYL